MEERTRLAGPAMAPGLYSVLLTLSSGTLLALLPVCIWWAVVCSKRDVQLRTQQMDNRALAAHYASKRRLMSRIKFLRGAQLSGCLSIVCTMTCVYLEPSGMTLVNMLGLLVMYGVTAGCCWGLVTLLQPHYEETLLDYAPVTTTCIISSFVLFATSGEYFHSSNGHNMYFKIFYHGMLWVLEETPLKVYWPTHATAMMLYTVTQLHFHPMLWSQPAQLAQVLLAYFALGVVMPVVLSGLVVPPDRPYKLPLPLYRTLCLLTVIGALLDALLQLPQLVEPIQLSVAKGHGNLLSRAFSRMLGPSNPPFAYNYGFSLACQRGLMFTMLAMLVTGSLYSLFAEEEEAPMKGPARKRSMTGTALAYLRHLPGSKKSVIFALLLVAVLQLVGVALAVHSLAAHGAAAFATVAPVVLLGVMLGVVVQIFGLLYVAVVPPGSPTNSAPFMRSEDDTYSSHSVEHNSGSARLGMASPALRSWAGLTPMSEFGGSTQSGVSRGMSELLNSDDPAEFQNRIESLAHFKTFMQGLDHQPSVYSLEEFIRGAANAMKGIFPGVHHASFCLLNSTRSSVNMYTFLGEGAASPPRINVSVVPGTLIFHVLHNCQPVFISNIASFPGPYSDVQFMRFVLGLRSVACLPLVVAGTRILGVLRLGFETPWNWGDQEKSIAKQLALVLSSTSQSMRSPSGLVMQGRSGGSSRGYGGSSGNNGPNSQTYSSRGNSGAADSFDGYGSLGGSSANGIGGNGSNRPADGWLGTGGSSNNLGGNSSGHGPGANGGNGQRGASGARNSMRPLQGSNGASGNVSGTMGLSVEEEAAMRREWGLGPAPPRALSSQQGSNGMGGNGSSHHPTPASYGPSSFNGRSNNHGGGGGNGQGQGSRAGGGRSNGDRSRNLPDGVAGGNGSTADLGMKGGGPALSLEAAMRGGAAGGSGSVHELGHLSHAAVHASLNSSQAGQLVSQQQRPGSGLTLEAVLRGVKASPSRPSGGEHGQALGHGQGHGRSMGTPPSSLNIGGGGGDYRSSGTEYRSSASRRPQYSKGDVGGLGEGSMNLVTPGGRTELRRPQPSTSTQDGGTGLSSSGQVDLDDPAVWELEQHYDDALADVSAAARNAALREQGGVGGGSSNGGGGGASNHSADLKMLEVVGRGGFGSVYKAFWRGKIVAVKVLEHGDDWGGTDGVGADASGRRAALLEGAMTSTISHSNVVQTFDYRVVHLRPQPVAGSLSRHRVLQETHIIMEYCDRGSLQDAIEQGAFLEPASASTTPSAHGPDRGLAGGSSSAVGGSSIGGGSSRRTSGNGGRTLDMELVTLTLLEVATAMEYLHLHRITHRDLKPKNVLLKSDTRDRRGFTAKVSDFGLSQVLPDSAKTQVSTKYSGTVNYMPPELIEDGKIYPQGDVYAFAVLMWQLYTGLEPYVGMAHPQIMVGVVTHNLRPKIPEHTPERYKALINKCWRKDPRSRPSFVDVSAALRGMLNDKSWGAGGGTGGGGNGAISGASSVVSAASTGQN